MADKPKFADLGNLDENQRIALIGDAVMCLGKTCGVVVETDEKADRYVKKLTDKFPGIVVVARFHGPVKGTVTVKLGPPNAPNPANN